MEEQLKQRLSLALTEFEKQMAKIVQLASEQGGTEMVAKVLEEYRYLHDGYFEIMRMNMDKHHPDYEQIIKVANSEIDKLRDDIKKTEKVKDILNSTTVVVNFLGRTVIALSI